MVVVVVVVVVVCAASAVEGGGLWCWLQGHRGGAVLWCEPVCRRITRAAPHATHHSTQRASMMAIWNPIVLIAAPRCGRGHGAPARLRMRGEGRLRCLSTAEVCHVCWLGITRG